MYQKAVDAGLSFISIHKGFPLQFGPQSPVRVQSIDIPKFAAPRESDPLTQARAELLDHGPVAVVKTHGPRTLLDEKVEKWRRGIG